MEPMRWDREASRSEASSKRSPTHVHASGQPLNATYASREIDDLAKKVKSIALDQQPPPTQIVGDLRGKIRWWSTEDLRKVACFGGLVVGKNTCGTALGECRRDRRIGGNLVWLGQDDE